MEEELKLPPTPEHDRWNKRALLENFLIFLRMSGVKLQVYKSLSPLEYRRLEDSEILRYVQQFLGVDPKKLDAERKAALADLRGRQ